MADKKISALTALAQGDVVVSTDVLPIVDTSATETKKIAVNALVGAAAAAGLTNVDINSGTIDGTTIATSDITVGSGKTLNVSAGTLTLADNQISGDKVEGGTINAITINTLTSTAVNATTVDATNVEVTNIKAKDGTAAGSIADSTGVVTLASSVLTTTDINGGTIDGTAIGASSASTGAFSTLSASGNVTLSGGTANGVLYLNASKVATSGSALTFDGTNFIIGGGGGLSRFNVSNNGAGGFEVNPDGTASGPALIAYNRGSSAFLQMTCNALTHVWQNSSSEQMRLTSTGLGIGTSSPLYRLDVRGAGAVISVGDTGTAGATLFGQVNSGNNGVGAIQFFNGGDMGFDTGATGAAQSTKMRLTASGNLGIGTSSPQRKIHGYIATGPVARFQTSGSNAATEYVPGATDGTGAIYNWVIGAQYNVGNTFEITPSTAAGGLTFSTPAFVVNSSGNVGIGTSSPGARLHVSTASADTIVRVGNNSTYDQYIYFQGNNDWSVGMDYSNSNAFTISNNSVLGTNDRLVLTTSGNLGLGVTPSAWNTDYRALQIKGGVSLSNDGGNTDLRLSQNVFVNSSAQNIYIATAAATRYRQNAGAHYWDTAASGTAGNTISFGDPKMTLDASGNLLVGKTSGSYRFDLQGAAGENATLAGFFSGTNTNRGLTLGLSAGGGAANDAYVVYNSTVAGGYAGHIWQAAGTERARITSGGYFKASNAGTYLGSTGDYHELRTDSAGNSAVQISSTSGSYTSVVTSIRANRNTTNNTFYAVEYYNDAAAAAKFRVADSGDCTNTNGTYAAISDIKLKEDVVDAASQWDDIKNLRVRKYRLKSEPDKVQIGLVAQEAETVSPGLVDEHIDRDEEGNDLGTTTKSVKYSILYMKSVKALQEAMARIEQLEAKVAALETK